MFDKLTKLAFVALIFLVVLSVGLIAFSDKRDGRPERPSEITETCTSFAIQNCASSYKEFRDCLKGCHMFFYEQESVCMEDSIASKAACEYIRTHSPE